VPDPGVALLGPNPKRCVAYAEAGMPTLRAVVRRPAPVLLEESGQMATGRLQVLRIEGPQQPSVATPS